MLAPNEQFKRPVNLSLCLHSSDIDFSDTIGIYSVIRE